MGRPVGSRELTVKQIKRIVELTLEGWNRPDIADDVDVAKRTVWRYQKEFDLV